VTQPVPELEQPLVVVVTETGHCRRRYRPGGRA
jgi:hypothetical protein